MRVVKTQHHLAYLFILFTTIYLLFFHRLGVLGLVGPDEPRYAQVAKEMSRSGDWVTPRLHQEPWFEKPILLYWLVAASFKAFGISEIAARLPSALFALVGCLAVFEMGRRWVNARCGLTAGLILATSPLYFSLARATSFDMLLTVFLTLSLATFLVAVLNLDTTVKSKDERPGSTPCVHWSFYIYLSLAVLAKGPVALVLVGISILSFLLIERRSGLFLNTRLALGCAIIMLVALPWYLVCYSVNGWIFFQKFIIEHNLARFTTDRFQHAQPVWFFVPVLLVGFFPWFFQPLSGATDYLRRSRDRTDKIELLLWIWCVVPLLFFSASQSKLPAYILPAVPALSLLTARQWERVWQNKAANESSHRFRISALLQGFAILAIGLSLPLFIHKLVFPIGSLVRPLAFSLCVIGTTACLLAYRTQWKPLFGIYVASMLLLVTLILHVLIPTLDPVESMRDLAEVMKSKAGYSGEPIYLYKLSRRVEYGLDYYLDTKSRVVYAARDLTYPSNESIFLLSPSNTNVDSLITGAHINEDLTFHEQRIMRVKRPSVTALGQ